MWLFLNVLFIFLAYNGKFSIFFPSTTCSFSSYSPELAIKMNICLFWKYTKISQCKWILYAKEETSAWNLQLIFFQEENLFL